jgi:hypothetical protein
MTFAVFREKSRCGIHARFDITSAKRGSAEP